MKKKMIALLMAATMVTPMAAYAEESAGEVIEIEFWNPGNDGDTAEESSEVRNVEAFNALYEGKIKINLVQIGNDASETEQKFQMAASGGNLPDLMIMNCGKEFSDYIDAGYFCNMSDYLNNEEFVSRFAADALTLQGNGQYSESTMYGIPTEADVQGWFYNTALFEQCGLELPKTFDDMLNCIAVFKENDIIPLMHGALDQWPLWGYWPWFSSLGFTMEEDYWTDFVENDLKVADCESLRKVFEYMQQLQEAGAYPENVANLNNTQAQELFMSGGAAMYCGGDWMGTAMDECAIAEDIYFDCGPQFADSIYDQTVAMRPYSFVFAFGASLNEDEAKKEAVATFMDWWYSEDVVVESMKVTGATPVTILSDTSVLDELGPVSSQIANQASVDGVVAVIDPNSWCAYDGSTTVIWNAMTSIITGTIDAEEALSLMQDWVDRL